jgi:hypothetical protein
MSTSTSFIEASEASSFSSTGSAFHSVAGLQFVMTTRPLTRFDTE